METQTIPPSKIIEKRQAPRWEIDGRVWYQLENETEIKEAKALNLTCTGIGICSTGDLAPLQKIKITFFLNLQQPLSVKGTACWSKKSGHEIFAGITFNNPHHETQNLILQYALDLNRKEVIKHWFKGW